MDQPVTEVSVLFKEMFPLSPEEFLPRKLSDIPNFLRGRIAIEMSESVRHFQSRVVKILCEVSPPKNHVEDMARICVQAANDRESWLRQVAGALDVDDFRVDRDGLQRLLNVIAKLKTLADPTRGLG